MPPSTEHGTAPFRGSDIRARYERLLLKTREFQALRDEKLSMDASLRSAALAKTCVDLGRILERWQEVEDILREQETDLRELAALRTILGEVVLPPQSVGTSGGKGVWATLTGDDRKRRCGECSGSVYELTGMTHEEAVVFVATNEPVVGAVALHSRRDGRFHSNECAGAVANRMRRRRLSMMVAVCLGTAGVQIGLLARDNAPHERATAVIGCDGLGR